MGKGGSEIYIKWYFGRLNGRKELCVKRSTSGWTAKWTQGLGIDKVKIDMECIQKSLI